VKFSPSKQIYYLCVGKVSNVESNPVSTPVGTGNTLDKTED